MSNYEKDIFEDDDFGISQLNNAIGNSLEPDTVEIYYKDSRHEISTSKLVVGAVTVFVTGAVAVTATWGALMDFIGYAQDKNYANSVAISYAEMVNDKCHRTDDKQGYWVDTSGLATSILECEDYHEAVYGVYRNIGYNDESTKKLMNEVFSHMGRQIESDQYHYIEYPKYQNFDNYLAIHGFKDTDDYEKEMVRYLAAKKEMNEVLNQGNKK